MQINLVCFTHCGTTCHGCRCIFTHMESSLLLYISTFQFDGQDLTKDGTGLDRSSSDCTDMANTGLVGIFTADDKWAMSNTTKTTGHSQPSTQARSKTSTNKNALRGFLIIRQALQCQGVPREAEDVIITALRDSTK